MPRGLVCKDGVWAEVDINSENIGADHQRGIFRWQIISIEHETPDVRHYAARLLARSTQYTDHLV